MKTANEILMDKAIQKDDGFLSGQIGWIVEAMEDYSKLNVEHELRMKHAEFEDRYEGRIETQENKIENLKAEKAVLLEALITINNAFWTGGETESYKIRDLKNISSEAIKQINQ